MSKLAFDSSLLIIGKFLSGICSIAAGVVLARWLTVEQYGTYSQLILIASTLTLFSTLSLPKSLYYFIPRAENSKKKLVALQILLFTLITSFCFALVLFPSAPLLAHIFQNKIIEHSIYFVAVYLFCLSMSSIFEPLLITLGQAKLVSTVESFTGVALFLAVIIPIFLGLDYRNILIFMSLVLAVKVLLTFRSTYRLEGQVKLQHIFKGISPKIKYSLPLAIDSMIGVIGRRIDQIIISLYFLPSQYAVYARGAFELPLVSVIPMTIFNLMLPQFTKDLMENMKERVHWNYGDKSRRVALLFFPLTVLMWILAEAFIILLFSEKYRDSIPIFRVYLLLLPMRINMSGTIVKAAGKTTYFLWGNLLLLGSNIALSLILIKLCGIIGAALATVLSVILYVLYIMNINCKILGVKMKIFLPWHDLAMIMVVSILSGLTIVPVLSMLNSNLFKLLCGASFFLICYIIYGYFFKILKKRDIELLKNSFFQIKNRFFVNSF